MSAHTELIVPLILITAAALGSSTNETKAQFDKRTQWWRESRFGMFIHWGVYSVPAAGEWYLSTHKVPVADYEKFAPQFDPVNFDAKKWVNIAKNAGMKYIVITSKHHDGFDMYDTKLSDWCITKATPFHRDPLKELAAECKRQGIHLCFYYSIMDWHHPDYLPRRPWDNRPTEGADMNRYVDYLKGQLTELLSNYGPIGVLWFDGEWEDTWNHDRGVDLYEWLRAKWPSLIINNRVDSGRAGLSGMNPGETHVGDFGTPEQTIPGTGYADGRLWETCMTMNDNWGFAKNDHDWKSPADLIHKLCDIASKGGNFLLNVGPTALGEIPEPSVDRLKIMGDWLKTNGESIYGTSAGPFRRTPFDGRATVRGDKVFLQVFHWPEHGLRLDGLKTPVVSATALLDSEKLDVTNDGGVVQIGEPSVFDPYATVVMLQLKGKPVVEAGPIRARTDGSYLLEADDADVHGGAHTETIEGQQNIGYWVDKSDYVAWDIGAGGGRYAVELEFACANENAGSEITIGAEVGSRISHTVTGTGTWRDFRKVALGEITLPNANRHTVTVRVNSMPHGAVMNLRRLVLKAVK